MIFAFAVLFVTTIGEGVSDATAELVLTSTVNIAQTAAADGDMTAATPVTLATFDPSVTYVGESHESTSMSIVSVDATDPSQFIAAIRSESGNCVFVRFISGPDSVEWNHSPDATCAAGSAPATGWTPPIAEETS